MALASSLAQLQAEASCPVCLDYLRDPVTTGCGHNFCHSCIQQCWEGLWDIFPCPVCLQHCPDKSIRGNSQLCHMIDFVRQLPNTEDVRKWQKEKPLCEKHKQVLSLFCEKDLELLCPQCRVSSDHSGHPLGPTEPAAASHRRMLKGYIEPLKKQLQDAEKALEMRVSESFELVWKVENRRRELLSEVEHFKRFWGMEHDEIHVRLLSEEKLVEDKIIEKRTQISARRSTLQSLLDEITEKCLQPDLDLLTDIERIHSTYGNLEIPEAFPYHLTKETFTLPPQYFGLHKMISTFHVDLTFNPETAHHSLIMSQDRKTATFRRMKPNCVLNPGAFPSHPAVLSSEGFEGGRHFWQVEGRGVGEWSLGVCTESFPRNGPISPAPNNGCWQIQLSTTPDTGDSGNRCRIGVFLDYELGEVSFYNLKDRSPLYLFCNIFTERLMPYFSIGPSSKSLTISLAEDEG
ncbi:tripartite motif-containing protein 60-like [Hippopotamus amphibius kiboko]|uniref:tripartite motif-containing protein 60-like n=1 Tax=Hippopotamus amphibius kiboko TaxID=575201 RepID=UPI002591C352|nr:tripartite motif-containing protein 60-like [Hippopotamus amphibius kiboko]